MALGKINVFSNIGIERDLFVNEGGSNTTAFCVRIVHFFSDVFLFF